MIQELEGNLPSTEERKLQLERLFYDRRIKMRYIRELKEGEMLSEVYLCRTKQSMKTKAGKTYYSLNLQDKTGILDGKIWELSNGIEHFEAMDYIQVDGQVTCFQGALQLNIRRVRKAQEGEYDPADYMPCSRYDRKEMYLELLKLISSVKEESLRKLLESFFVEDKEFAKRFCAHSAAKSVHHGFIGGLLEHTLGVAKTCEFICDRNDYLNRDLLLTAAILHDVGKVVELSAFPENDYTDEGQLLGHIFIGAEQIGEKVKEIPGFPPMLAMQLRHCILAHHGELEYGSPKKPALAEALALNLADNLDAKMETMRELLEAGPEKESWLGYNRMFESNIMRTVEK